MTDTLVLSNMELGDDTFDSDVGSWNVTRAKRDCAAGKHGVHGFDVEEVYSHNANIEVDAGKVDAMVADWPRLLAAPPLIFCMEGKKIFLIDGHHRLRALRRKGVIECAGYVIEENDAKPYRVYFNGKRIAPWHQT